MYFGQETIKKCDDGTHTISQEINGKKFEDLPLRKQLCEKCSNCAYNFPEACEVKKYGSVIKYQCDRKRYAICNFTDLIFGLLISLGTIFIYCYPLSMRFIDKVTCHFIYVVILFIINVIVDNIQPIIWNRKYYNQMKMLRKNKMRTEAKNEKARLKREKKEMEILKKIQDEGEMTEKVDIDPQIVYARSIIIHIDKLNNIYDFGTNKEKIKKCIQKLSEILFLLEHNNAYYEKARFLFELYLPEVYEALNYYSKYIENNEVTKSREKSLTRMVDNFLNYLQSQKLDGEFYANEIDIKFNRSISILNKYFNKGES